MAHLSHFGARAATVLIHAPRRPETGSVEKPRGGTSARQCLDGLWRRGAREVDSSYNSLFSTKQGRVCVCHFETFTRKLINDPNWADEFKRADLALRAGRRLLFHKLVSLHR